MLRALLIGIVSLDGTAGTSGDRVPKSYSAAP